MKTTIHVFLASSITDLEQDRESIGNFINELNNIYNKQNLFIHLHKCEGESEDHSIKRGGSQKSLNDEIRESDMCFVLFWHKAGNVTKEELYEAVKAFDLKENPKVVVYFKNLEEGEGMTEEVRQIMKEVDDELLHYHREYSHIDSLKLGIVTQLQAHGFLKVDMTVEDEEIKVAGHTVAATENIPVYSQNERYNELIEQFKDANKKCDELLNKYKDDKSNRKLFSECQRAIEARTRLQEDLTKISKGILNIGSQITKTILFSAPSKEICEAIQCFDRGDYDGVTMLLPMAKIDEYLKGANMVEEKANLMRLEAIDVARLHIWAKEALGRWQDVRDVYEHVIDDIKNHPTAPKAFMLEYARFLYRQQNFERCLSLCEQLQGALVQNPKAISEQETAELYDLQGELYYQKKRYQEAESFIKNAIELRIALDLQSEEKDMLIAESYVKLAKVYYMVTRYFEAEALYVQALDIYKKYDTVTIDKVDVNIAHTNLELAELYYMINRHEDAGKVILSAYKKYEELVNSGVKDYKAAMAEAAKSYAFLAIAVYSHMKAEPYYLHSMKVKQVLTQREPVEYYTFLERILNKLGSFWTENGSAAYGDTIHNEAERIHKVIQNNAYLNKKEEFRVLDYAYYNQSLNKKFLEELLLESIRMFKNLANENPEAYESSLAKAYNVTGYFYTQIDEKEKAEVNYNEAIEIGKRLVEREQSMKSILAISCSNLALHYFSYNKVDKAITRTLQAIDLYKTVKTNEDGAYDTDIARNYNTLANLYAKAGDKEKAEKYYMEALMLYLKLYEKSPRAYVDRIINTTNNIIMLFDPIESSDWMSEFVKEDKVLEWLHNKD